MLVVDWGLAKVRSDDAADKLDEHVLTTRAEANEETLYGAVQGSLPYMAPEQARGESDAVDARTDVFGLGAILYEILTGSGLYIDDSPQVALARARRGEVTPPSEIAREREVPRILEEICMTALAAAREDRYASAKVFHDALQRYIEGLHHAERRAAEAKRLFTVASEAGQR